MACPILIEIQVLKKKFFWRFSFFLCFSGGFSWKSSKILEMSVNIWWCYRKPSEKNRKNKNLQKRFFFNTWISIKIGRANFYGNRAKCVRETILHFLRSEICFLSNLLKLYQNWSKLIKKRWELIKIHENSSNSSNHRKTVFDEFWTFWDH